MAGRWLTTKVNHFGAGLISSGRTASTLWADTPTSHRWNRKSPNSPASP